jgi:hypothetical protein
MGLEGIVSKRLTVPYRSGPSASALESAAQRGRVGAAQTGASETEKLVTTLATRCARLPSLAAFARDLHSWLDKQPFAKRSIRGGKVLSAPRSRSTFDLSGANIGQIDLFGSRAPSRPLHLRSSASVYRGRCRPFWSLTSAAASRRPQDGCGAV